jgi:hypothetical protein
MTKQACECALRECAVCHGTHFTRPRAARAVVRVNFRAQELGSDGHADVCESCSEQWAHEASPITFSSLADASE